MINDLNKKEKVKRGQRKRDWSKVPFNVLFLNGELEISVGLLPTNRFLVHACFLVKTISP